MRDLMQKQEGLVPTLNQLSSDGTAQVALWSAMIVILADSKCAYTMSMELPYHRALPRLNVSVEPSKLIPGEAMHTLSSTNVVGFIVRMEMEFGMHRELARSH